ncbi:MAG TPA: MmgE/PrpD family protein [Steroidobacteraceae bacterium]
MSADLHCTRRWLLNAGGAALLANAVPTPAARAQAAGAAEPRAEPQERAGQAAISAMSGTLADYVTQTLNRPLPDAVLATTKLHVLDTLAAMVSGSRLKPGALAIRYIESLGGAPQATVVGTQIVTSSVNAAFANGMMAHADETDDTHPLGPFHVGCGVVSAALATGELSNATGTDILRSVALGYDVGARFLMSLGGTRHNPSCMTNTIATAATAAAMLRLDARQVRHVFSYAGQQASGMGYWDRDIEHIEKAFDFGGMGARNGVTAATLVAIGCTATDDPFSGAINILSVLGNKPAPEALVAELGTRFEVMNATLKKWSVGMPLQSVLDSTFELLANRAVRAANIKSIVVEISSTDTHIVDNNPNPDLCAQHLVALMIADRGVSFASVHDAARMQDPKVTAIRRRVQVVPSSELAGANPPHQAVITIKTLDGKSFENRTTAVRGLAQNPMDETEVSAKALDLMGPVLGAARCKQLIEAVNELERFGPIAGLRPLLQA